MIKVEVNEGTVTIKEMEGTAIAIMSELCCVVDAVCSAWSADESDAKEVRRELINSVANTLKIKNKLFRGTEIEDDENADF